MSELFLLLQESVVVDTDRGSGATTTILSLLREKMSGVDGLERRKKSFKERLGFGCCGGPIWGIRPTNMSVRDDDDTDDDDVGDIEIHHQLPEQPRLHQNGASAPNTTHNVAVLDQSCHVVLSDHHVSQSDGQSRANNTEDQNSTETPMASSMNLAAALAAERQYRAAHEPNGSMESDFESGLTTNRSTTDVPGTPLRMSLLRLLEETDGVEVGKVSGALVVDGCGGSGGGGGGDGVCDSMCCVCMGRKKGAAFIPCGHTFCRVCSRELWLNRGSCPLCNRPILEILDIF